MRKTLLGLAAAGLFAGTASAQLLFDNGAFVTLAGAGFGGADISRIQARLNTFGSTCSSNTAPNFDVADDFVVPAGKVWTPTSADFYVYQTTTATSVPPTTNTTPTIDQAFVTVWRDNPAGGGTVVAGDFTTNRMTAAAFANCFRITETAAATTSDRAIMKITVDLSFLGSLEAGHYTIGFKAHGTQTPNSGPFIVPVVPRRANDNAIQRNETTGLWALTNHNGGDVNNDGSTDISFQLNGTEADSAVMTNPYGWQLPPLLNIRQGRPFTIKVKTGGGANPASTAMTVTANLTNVGLSASQSLFDDGTNGDETPGDGVFTFTTTAIPNTTTLGVKTLPCTVADAEARSMTFNLVYNLAAPAPEIEANATKFGANVYDLQPGETITGNLTNGTAGADSDYFKVLLPPSPGGFTRYDFTLDGGANIASMTWGMIGATQTGGVINPNSNFIFAGAPVSGTARSFHFYTHGGSSNPFMYMRALGVATATTFPYTVSFASSAVTPTDIVGTFPAGDLTFDFSGQGHTTDTEIIVYDANYTPIPDWLNDDSILSGAAQSLLTRTFAAGTYYLAVGSRNLATNLASPVDDNNRNQAVIDSGGVTMTNQSTSNVNCAFSITDASSNVTNVPATRAGPYDVVLLKLVVSPAGPTACSPADLVDGLGVPPGDGFVTGTDADFFVQAYNTLSQRPNGSYYADLTDGFGGGPDGFVTGTDADYFTEKYFLGC